MPDSPILDYTNVDYQGFKQMMIAGLTETMPEYTDTSETDPGIIILELIARGLDIINYYQNAQANECFISTAERRENVMEFAKLLNYTPKGFTSSILTEIVAVKDPTDPVTVRATKSGLVITTKPETPSEEPIYFTTIRDLITTDSAGEYKYLVGYELTSGAIVETLNSPDQPVKNYLFAVPIKHGKIVENEVIGTSDGSERLQFTLSQAPVELDSIQIVTTPTTEGGNSIVWTKVNSFIDSANTDYHYTATQTNNNKVLITFGDNRSGRIPDRGAVIYASYRNGGGTVGNVGKQSVVRLPQSIYGVSYCYNLELFSDKSLPTDQRGYNAETLSSIKVNAPNHARTPWGCITLEDFATKLPELYHEIELADSRKPPLDEDETAIDDVYVYFLMRDNEGELVDGATADFAEEFRLDVLEMYDERKLVGTNKVEIKPTEFLGLKIEAVMYTYDDADFNDAKEGIIEYLGYRLSPGKMKYRESVSVLDLEREVIDNFSKVRSFRITKVAWQPVGIEYQEGRIPSTYPKLAPDDTEVLCGAGQIIILGGCTINSRG